MMFKPILMSFLFIPLAQAQLKGSASTLSWGGYWWSMIRSETSLGWENPEGRKNWTPSDIKSFTACLADWKKSCEKFSANQGKALSPLMKFDLYVLRKLEDIYGKGQVPVGYLSKAADYETKIHYIADENHPHYEAQGYAGKCNGWSISTFYHPEPTKNKVINGIVFTSADIKAILAVKYNASIYFVPDDWAIGNAVRADMSDEDYQIVRNDVLPHEFISALQTFVGKKKKPILADLDPEEGVWNHPVFAYEIKISSQTSTQIKGILTISYADDQVGIDEVFSLSQPRKDHLKRVLPFSASTPAGWKGDFSKIKKSKWTGEAINQHPDSLVLGIQDGWMETMRKENLQNTKLKNEINFQLFKRFNLGNGWEYPLSLLLSEYY